MYYSVLPILYPPHHCRFIQQHGWRNDEILSTLQRWCRTNRNIHCLGYYVGPYGVGQDDTYLRLCYSYLETESTPRTDFGTFGNNVAMKVSSYLHILLCFHLACVRR